MGSIKKEGMWFKTIKSTLSNIRFGLQMLTTLFCGKKENGDLNFGGELIIMRKLGKTGSVQLCLNDAEEGKEGCP